MTDGALRAMLKQLAADHGFNLFCAKRDRSMPMNIDSALIAFGQAAYAAGAADARAEENEACAKIAEGSKAKQEAFVDKYASGYNACSVEIAEAIRARLEKRSGK